MKKRHDKIIFAFIKKIFLGLLSACTALRLQSNSEGQIKCISPHDQPCQA